jgi:prepilin-type N-terminal cleavage/methylation domain-containing protein
MRRLILKAAVEAAEERRTRNEVRKTEKKPMRAMNLNSMTKTTRTRRGGGAFVPRTSFFVHRSSRSRGLSLVEVLIALAITAMLMAATMAATHASFRAYADACEQASSQAATRMITNRLLTLIRTSTAHGPLMPNGSNVTLSGTTITSDYIELLDPNGNYIKMSYKSSSKELWLSMTPASGGAEVSQPLIGGVTAASFFAVRRQNDEGLWVLERGTIDLTVEPGQDATLTIESGHPQPIRVVASTKPRKLD